MSNEIEPTIQNLIVERFWGYLRWTLVTMFLALCWAFIASEVHRGGLAPVLTDISNACAAAGLVYIGIAFNEWLRQRSNRYVRPDSHTASTL